MEEKNLYTLQEVAEVLGVHREFIYLRVRDNVIPAIKVGSSWRVTHETLQGILQNGVK